MIGKILKILFLIIFIDKTQKKKQVYQEYFASLELTKEGIINIMQKKF